MKMTESSGNVFLDMGFEPEEAAVMMVKAQLRIELEKEIKRRKLNQSQAAELMSVSRPMLNRILNDKLDKITIDKMVQLHSRLGKRVDVQVKRQRKVA